MLWYLLLQLLWQTPPYTEKSLLKSKNIFSVYFTSFFRCCRQPNIWFVKETERDLKSGPTIHTQTNLRVLHKQVGGYLTRCTRTAASIKMRNFIRWNEIFHQASFRIFLAIFYLFCLLFFIAPILLDESARNERNERNNEQQVLVNKDQSALSPSPSSCHCGLIWKTSVLETYVSQSAIYIKCYVPDF